MDWLNELPAVTGIDKVVAEMAQRLMSGPMIFKSPFWNGNVAIETSDDYRAWVRTVKRIENEPDKEARALNLWVEEKSRISAGARLTLQLRKN